MRMTDRDGTGEAGAWPWRRIAWLALVAFVAGAIVVVVLSGFRQRTAASAYVHAKTAQETASAFETERLLDPDRLESAATRLIEAESAHHKGEDPAWQGAVRAVLDLLRAWASGDPAVYAHWRAAQGFELPPVFVDVGMQKHDFRALIYRDAVGRDMPEGITPREFFDDYFRAYFGRAGEELRPESLAVHPLSIEVGTYRITHYGDFDTSLERSGGLGPLFWRGGIVIGGLMLWWPDRVIESADAPEPSGGRWALDSILEVQRVLFAPLIERYGPLAAAKVMVVYRGATGVNVPLTAFLIRRPTDGAWEVTGLSIGNVGSDVGVGSNELLPPPY